MRGCNDQPLLPHNMYPTPYTHSSSTPFIAVVAIVRAGVFFPSTTTPSVPRRRVARANNNIMLGRALFSHASASASRPRTLLCPIVWPRTHSKRMGHRWRRISHAAIDVSYSLQGSVPFCCARSTRKNFLLRLWTIFRRLWCGGVRKSFKEISLINMVIYDGRVRSWVWENQ